MGKIRDWCLATGETEREWVGRSNPVARGALRGKDYPLPGAYKRRQEGRAERDTQKAALKLCGQIFAFSVRIEGGGKIMHGQGEAFFGASSQKGMPDILCCHRGQMYGLEVKAPGGHVSVEQYAKLKEMHDAGAKVCIVVDETKIAEWVSIGTYTSQIDGWLDVL